MKVTIMTSGGFIEVDGEVGDVLYELQEENRKLRRENTEFKVELFSIKCDIKINRKLIQNKLWKLGKF